MPGSIRSMQLEHVLRNVQTDRGSLLHGRLLRWQFDTATLAHRCRRGASTPSPAYRILAACYAHMGRLDEAREIIVRLRAITPLVVPSDPSFRNPADRALWFSGLRLAAGEM